MSSFNELDVFDTQLTNYFTALATNFGNPASTLPSFEDYSTTLSYDVLLTEAQAGAIRAASYSTGALVDSVHMIAAIQREFNMRTKTKAQYFLDAQDDMNRVVDFIGFMRHKYSNYMRGTTPEQSKE